MKETHTRLIEEDLLSHMLNNGYLSGKLLVATPLVRDPHFSRSVVYILSHDEGGATGVIINHVIKDMQCSAVFEHLNIDHLSGQDAPVHYGGPVDSSRGFVLHTDNTPYGAIALSTSLDTLKDIAMGAGPRKSIFALGYAEWEAGQLEQELQENSWIVVPATEELVFDTSNTTKWEDAVKSLGVDMARFSTVTGNA